MGTKVSQPGDACDGAYGGAAPCRDDRRLLGNINMASFRQLSCAARRYAGGSLADVRMRGARMPSRCSSATPSCHHHVGDKPRQPTRASTGAPPTPLIWQPAFTRPTGLVSLVNKPELAIWQEARAAAKFDDVR